MNQETSCKLLVRGLVNGKPKGTRSFGDDPTGITVDPKLPGCEAFWVPDFTRLFSGIFSLSFGFSTEDSRPQEGFPIFLPGLLAMMLLECACNCPPVVWCYKSALLDELPISMSWECSKLDSLCWLKGTLCEIQGAPLSIRGAQAPTCKPQAKGFPPKKALSWAVRKIDTFDWPCTARLPGWHRPALGP